MYICSVFLFSWLWQLIVQSSFLIAQHQRLDTIGLLPSTLFVDVKHCRCCRCYVGDLIFLLNHWYFLTTMMVMMTTFVINTGHCYILNYFLLALPLVSPAWTFCLDLLADILELCLHQQANDRGWKVTTAFASRLRAVV